MLSGQTAGCRQTTAPCQRRQLCDRGARSHSPSGPRATLQRPGVCAL